MDFNPGNIQEWGIGISAFLAILFAAVIFVSDARADRTARSFGEMMAAIFVWSGFGLLFQITPNIPLARDFRVLSVEGIVLLMYAGARFAYNYAADVRPPKPIERAVLNILFAIGVVFTAILLFDLGPTRIIVGNLLTAPPAALAPQAGPVMPLLILYHVVCMIVMAWFFVQYVRTVGSNIVERRRTYIVAGGLLIALTIGMFRYTEWYGFEFYALLTGLSVPLIVVSMFYAIRKYQLFNIRMVAAQLVVFMLWTFTFFRILLDPTIRAAEPDIAFFVGVLILGVLLLRSVIMEEKSQRELAALLIDRAKSEFVTIAAHQLRTPLSAVRWTFSLLLSDQDNPLSFAQRDIATKGARAADMIMALADDFLNVAQFSDGKLQFNLEPGDMRDVARVALGLFEDTAKRRNISLTAEYPDSMPDVVFDRGKLAIAMENLLDNAIKYTHDGGSVSLCISHDDKTATIAITDTGVGILREELPRLSEKFFRGKRAVQMATTGSGLGLFITKTIIDGHHGTITFESHEAQGTTATIALPLPAVSS